MASHVIDSAYFSDLYGTPEMRAVWNDHNLLQKWLDFEAALARAEEYLRNLARLPLKHITVQSYGGQWYEVQYPSATQLAGEHFYGQHHDFPDNPLLRRVIHNQNTFCIPENEALINDTVATQLQPLCDGRTPDQLTLDEQTAVRAICDQALGLMQHYMDIHAEALPDRGCEGTLISFYYTSPAVLKRIRAEYGSGQSLSLVTAQTFDAPPSPIAQEESH